jgi:glyoxylase-like metal-dependent hydrolase (beta-lactamase superfamily II)
MGDEHGVAHLVPRCPCEEPSAAAGGHLRGRPPRADEGNADGSGATFSRRVPRVEAPIKAERIRDKLYLLRGGGRTVSIGGVSLPTAGNSLAFIGSSGVMLVDSKVPGCGKAILDSIREITDRPVTTIINTHTHFDHVGSNPEFAETVEVIAHEKTAALMREMRPVSGGPAQPDIFRESGGRGLPRRTFEDRLTLGSGEERIDLYWFGPAHTAGDAWVVFPALSVLHAGDVFAHKALAPLDANNGASGVAYPQTIAAAVAALSKIETVVSGHYPSTLAMADLETYGQFIGEFVEAVRKAKRAGGTIDDFVKAWKIPERFLDQGYVDTTHLRPIRPDVEVIWNESG